MWTVLPLRMKHSGSKPHAVGKHEWIPLDHHLVKIITDCWGNGQFRAQVLYLEALFNQVLRNSSSVHQFSHSVVSNSLWPHELQHARPPCPSPTPRVHPNSCPLSRWCHPIISSPVVPSPLAFNLSQHQGVFKWVSSSHQVAKVLEFQL